MDCSCQVLTQRSSLCSHINWEQPCAYFKSTSSSPAQPQRFWHCCEAAHRAEADPVTKANRPRWYQIRRTTCGTITEHKMHPVLANNRGEVHFYKSEIGSWLRKVQLCLTRVFFILFKAILPGNLRCKVQITAPCSNKIHFLRVLFFPQPFMSPVFRDSTPLCVIKVQLNTNELRSESLQKDTTTHKIKQLHNKSTEENYYLEHKETKYNPRHLLSPEYGLWN